MEFSTRDGARVPRIALAIGSSLLIGLAACSSNGGPGAPSQGNPADTPTTDDTAGVQARPEVDCAQRNDERITAMSDDGIMKTSDLGLPPGRYALPDEPAPTNLVVMFHGHNNDSCSWRDHLRAAAAQGAIAVAMDYTGTVDQDVEGIGFVENYGWPVRAGAADSIEAAKYFLAEYPSLQTVFNFAVSMGGNVGGYALYSADARREDGSALWDYWVAAEGVHNLSEEYLGIRTVAQQSADPGLRGAAALAQMEIEEENGGTIEQNPAAYEETTNVSNVGGMSSLKGAVLIHGQVDATVPTDQSLQMQLGLQSQGVPARLFSVFGSGHVWEGNDDTVIMATALSELFRLMAGGSVENGGELLLGP